MKAKLIFDLDDLDDRLSHSRAVNADKAYSALCDITMELRRLRKYGDKEDVNIDELEDKILNIINENGINLDKDYQ